MKIFTWIFLTQKRLLKKKSVFVMILILLALTAFFKFTAAFKSGAVNIAVFVPDSDELSLSVCDELFKSNFILYKMCKTSDEAFALLENKKVSAVWMFKENLSSEVKKCAAEKTISPLVYITENQDDAVLSFAREILYSHLYKAFSYEVSASYIKNTVGLYNLQDADIKRVYSYYESCDDIFVLKKNENIKPIHTMPFRGLLSLWFSSCGFAAILYAVKDKKNGLYGNFSPLKQEVFFASQTAVILFDAAVCMILCIYICGLNAGFFYEVYAAIVFYALTVLFCTVIKKLFFENAAAISAAFPLLIMTMAVFTPVFISLKLPFSLGRIFPMYTYLNMF